MSGLGNLFRKKTDPKNLKKTVKIIVKVAACEQKTTSEKAKESEFLFKHQFLTLL